MKAILAADTNYSSEEAEKEFTIFQAASTVAIHDDLNKVYDGVAVSNPTNVATTGSGGLITFEWYTFDGQKLDGAPIDVGTYKVKAILAADINYIGAEVEKEFTISQATTTIIINDQLDKVYDGKPVSNPQISVVGSNGPITFEWYTSDGRKLDGAPVDVGTYKVKAILAADINYIGAEVEKEFTISQATTTIIINNQLDKVYDEKPVLNPQISVVGSSGLVEYEWYKKEKSATKSITWIKLTTAPSEVGNYKLVVTVEQDMNYQGATTEVEFHISEKVIEKPSLPEDSEDNQDVSKPTGSQIDSVQTGDGTQLGLWTLLAGISAGLMTFFTKKKYKDEI